MLSRVARRDIHFAVENELQLFERLVVERVADQHLERAILLGQRNDRVFAGDRLGHQFDNRRRNRHVAQVEEFVAVHVGHRLHHLLARGVALLDEDLVDLAAVLLGDGLRLGQLLGADDATSNEVFAQVCHDCTASMLAVPQFSERPIDPSQPSCCAIAVAGRSPRPRNDRRRPVPNRARKALTLDTT